jgi:colanic acid/amylovoran biosynthesis protein
LHPLILSRLLGKPTVLFSQSFGPFKYGAERRLIGLVVNRCVTLALVREDQSMDFLVGVGVTNAIRSVDSGFLLNADGATSDLRRALGLRPDQLVVGVTALSWLDPGGQARYEVSMAGLADHLISNHGAFIVFIPQVTAAFFNDDDRVVARSIAERVTHRDRIYLLEEELNCHELKAIYEDIDLLIGTRFHSVIFSLTSQVPALVVQYNHKASGIMEDLELGKWVVNIEDVSIPTMTRKVDELVEAAPRYRDHLASIIPQYQRKAREAAELTRLAYESFVALRRASGNGERIDC